MPLVCYPIINGIIDLTNGIADPDIEEVYARFAEDVEFVWVMDYISPEPIDLTESVEVEVEGW